MTLAKLPRASNSPSHADGASTCSGATLPAYTAVLEASLELSRRLARAKLASDIRFMMVSGYVHSRLVDRRYPWMPADVLRPAFVELVIDAMVTCLREGARTAPVAATAKKRAGTRSAR